MKKNLLIILAVAFQVLAVASMAISKEWLLSTGQEVVLQTAPIDPRDIFKGDYVRLDYAFSKISMSQLDESFLVNGLDKGQKVYLSLTTDENGLAQGERLSLSPPADVTYLTGRVKSPWPYYGYKKSSAEDRNRKIKQQAVNIKYGLEQYYVEQGKGLEMEKIRGGRDDFQVPMLIHVAVSDSGESVIRSFEWASIAMKTEIQKSPQADAADDQASAIMSFTILNRGELDITLPWKANGCSFNLIARTGAPISDSNEVFKRTECEAVGATQKILKPGEKIALTFDLNLTQWWVDYKGRKTPMGKLPWDYRFRIVYNEENIKGIRAKIISRAFHGRGNID